MKPSEDWNWENNVVWLLFWPIFGLRYLLLESCHPAKHYHPVHCMLDDRIPFLEWFLIPYVLWYGAMAGMHLWLYLRRDQAFRQYSRYLLVSMGISTAVFLLFPTCQNLRPQIFPRENGLTELVAVLYRLDTSTNVCPSEHVIGSVGYFLAALYCADCRRFLPGIGLLALLTALATVFLKQHSVVDVVAALPVCAVGWYAGFYRQIPEKNGERIRILRKKA